MAFFNGFFFSFFLSSDRLNHFNAQENVNKNGWIGFDLMDTIWTIWSFRRKIWICYGQEESFEGIFISKWNFHIPVYSEHFNK